MSSRDAITYNGMMYMVANSKEKEDKKDGRKRKVGRKRDNSILR
jgi:hypothetical protein